MRNWPDVLDPLRKRHHFLKQESLSVAWSAVAIAHIFYLIEKRNERLFCRVLRRLVNQIKPDSQHAKNADWNPVQDEQTVANAVATNDRKLKHSAHITWPKAIILSRVG